MNRGGRKMTGILYSMIAGIFICLQSVFNTRASEKIGLLGTVTFVHGLGFLVSIIILLFVKYEGFSKIGEVNKLYLLGGIFGIIIVFSVMKGITLLGVTYSVSILLSTQLVASLLIDSFGLFGIEKIRFTLNKPFGIIVMIIGILIVKMK